MPQKLLHFRWALVQIFADGSPAEYTPIGEWVRETSVFNMMKQLSFFRNYMPQASHYLLLVLGNAAGAAAHALPRMPEPTRTLLQV